MQCLSHIESIGFQDLFFYTCLYTITYFFIHNLPCMLDMLIGTNHLLDFKNWQNHAQKSFFYKKVKSGRQVLKNFQNTFCKQKKTDKNKLKKMLNHSSQVRELRWVTYKNLACQFFFYNNCCCTFCEKSVFVRQILQHSSKHFSWILFHFDKSPRENSSLLPRIRSKYFSSQMFKK